MLRSLLLALLLPTIAWAAPSRPVRSRAFDWDGNTVAMSTRVYLKSKSGAPELAVSTTEWLKIEKQVGKPGPYADRYLDRDKRTGGYRDLTDNGKENLFLRDLRKTLQTSTAWRGPSWNDFVEQLSTPSGARRATIITARDHSPQTLYDGLKWLRSQGHIRYVPPRANLFGVNVEGLRVYGKPLTGDTPARKLSVEVKLLDDLQRHAELNRGRRQEWHFSDDEWDNYEATRNGLKQLVAEGRWPNIDIILHYTGKEHRGPQVATLRGL